MLISENLERALRWAAIRHQGQMRRGSGTPYFEHVVAVAMILDRLDYPEPVVIAGLLHDVIEDTATTLDEIQSRFGSEVARIVESCTEVKTDPQGNKRPWIDRKQDQLVALAKLETTDDARAVVLADKLHNLRSMVCDRFDGVDIWTTFNAERPLVLWYYRTMIDLCGRDTAKLERLARECRSVLTEVERLS